MFILYIDLCTVYILYVYVLHEVAQFISVFPYCTDSPRIFYSSAATSHNMPLVNVTTVRTFQVKTLKLTLRGSI